MYTSEQVLPLMEGSYGEVCCRKRVGYYYSLAVDFGEKEYHNHPKNVDPFYGEWQFRTYNRVWRIIKDKQVILEGQNNSGTNDDVDDALQKIEFGQLINILVSNTNDLVLKVDNGLSIEFLSCKKDKETCAVFLPQNRCLAFYKNQDWGYGRGDIPWPNHLELDYEW